MAQLPPLESEIHAAIQSVLRNGNYILGGQVSAFEAEFSAYLGVTHVIGCGSGTDAIVLALRALDIGPGDEVIVPSHTATATVTAVMLSGATPVYADISADCYTLDIQKVEEACSARTKAVIAVHLYGQATDLDGLLEITRRRRLRLIEDCAQAAGASFREKKLGTIGDIGCFSFFPTKNLGAIGDAGAVVCKDAEIAARIRRLRQYGWDDRRISIETGMNSRLDEMQAAILRVKLPHLDQHNTDRAQQAVGYKTTLADLPIILPAQRAHSSHVYHLFVIRTSAADRDMLIQHLARNGITCGIHYATPVHLMPAFNGKHALPITESIVKEIVSLPMFPGLDKNAQERVISSIRAFYAR
ncbi:MAG TPA: DegT/DnrJ/EryC1/StrS family aminotransferase [Methylophilaceae bacterium]|nr:DegT/DnrJ/EryC1/StrS family aminotransferase [Methylophilaceae bacterium]